MVSNDYVTALHLLTNVGMNFFHLDGEPPSGVRASEFLHKEFPKMRPLFSKKIQSVDPRLFAEFQTVSRQMDLFTTEVPFHESGTMIIPMPKGAITVFYNINVQEGGRSSRDSYTLSSFLTDESLPEPFLIFFAHVDSLEQFSYMASYPPIPRFESETHTAETYRKEILDLVDFIKLMKPTSVLVSANGQEALKDSKYTNDTSFTIEVLHSLGISNGQELQLFL